MIRPSPIRLATALFATILLALAGAVAAQTTYEHGLGFRIDLPSGWIVDEDGNDQEVMLFVLSPENDGGLIIAVGPLEGGDRDAYLSGGLEGLIEPAFALVAEIPGVQRGDVFAATMGGRDAAGFAYQAGSVGGRFVFTVSGEQIYVVGSLADPAPSATIDAALQASIASFTLTNPNAAGGTSGGAAGDPFVGTFRGDGVTLALDRAPDGSYVGTLTHGASTYPATATPSGNGLIGRFVVGSDAFDFELTMAGDSLVLSTGGTRYSLGR